MCTYIRKRVHFIMIKRAVYQEDILQPVYECLHVLPSKLHSICNRNKLIDKCTYTKSEFYV